MGVVSPVVMGVEVVVAVVIAVVAIHCHHLNRDLGCSLLLRGLRGLGLLLEGLVLLLDLGGLRFLTARLLFRI